MRTQPTRLERLSEAAKISYRLYLDDVEARDAEIGRLDAEGVGIRKIAREAGLSPGHTQRIILARAAARQRRS